MKTIEVEVALMKRLDFRQNVIVPNVSWGMHFPNARSLHECDLLMLSKAGYATEVEIKVSKSDLLRDAHKKHSHEHKAIKYLYFAVPITLKEAALAEIPDRAGLYIITHSGYAKLVRKAEARKDPIKWEDKERNKLLQLGCMRIRGLKCKIIKLQNKTS